MLEPDALDFRYVRELGDGNFEVAYFAEQEVHSAIFSLNPNTETVFVFSVTRLSFRDESTVKLDD
jgi:hypothetical protein